LLLNHELFLDTDPETCDREIKVILYGTMNCARAVLPGMVERRFGKLINIVTDAARVGQERQCNYSAAKGGVISFTKSIAKEVGRHNINVNAVSPGATNSPMRMEMLRQLRENIGEEKAAEREAVKIRAGRHLPDSPPPSSSVPRPAACDRTARRRAGSGSAAR